VKSDVLDAFQGKLDKGELFQGEGPPANAKGQP
jgi:hypothetical protein